MSDHVWISYRYQINNSVYTNEEPSKKKDNSALSWLNSVSTSNSVVCLHKNTAHIQNTQTKYL